MLFRNNPHTMTDDELAVWATRLIELRVPESEMLDYKAELDLENHSKSSRAELAKDLSSFANERGGVYSCTVYRRMLLARSRFPSHWINAASSSWPTHPSDWRTSFLAVFLRTCRNS